MIEGLVVSGSNNIFQVEIHESSFFKDENTENFLSTEKPVHKFYSKVVSCSIKGKVLKDVTGFYNPLAPGDMVNIEIDSKNSDVGQIVSLVERKNSFSRWNSKGRAPQLLAANVDYLICVTTPENPPFRPRFVDRILIQAANSNIEPIIVLNKIDCNIDPDVDERVEEWVRLGYKIFRLSAKTGVGIDEFSKYINGKLSVLVGQSGVGKSCLVNALDCNQKLKTGSLCEKHDRGAHTTTRGTLLHLNTQWGQTSVIDTPGVRRFSLDGVRPQDVIYYFPEMADLVGSCSFGMSCTHTKESGCKIQEALYSGLILEDRYESWLRLKSELESGSYLE